jgi:hypothetical protein
MYEDKTLEYVYLPYITSTIHLDSKRTPPRILSSLVPALLDWEGINRYYVVQVATLFSGIG